MKPTKTVKIYCVDCGKPRLVPVSNKDQTKRCEKCQYKQKRKYNTAYITRRRAEARKTKKK